MQTNKQRTPGRLRDSRAAHASARAGLADDAVETLVRLWDEGHTVAEVAARLGRTVRAVECKIYKLRAAGRALSGRRPTGGPRAAQRARRRCLYCDSMFPSAHPGNRLCPACLEDGPFTSAMV